MQYPKDGAVTPKFLRELADMIEKHEAYGEMYLDISHETRQLEYLGRDGFDRNFRRMIDKSLTLKVSMIGPVEVQSPTGDWWIY